MFLCDYFTFLVFSSFAFDIIGKCNGYYYSTLDNGKNKKYSQSPMKITNVRSKLDCCRKCEAFLGCTSVNYIKSSKKCEILTGIPILFSQLTPQEDSVYFEKVCHQDTQITSASSANTWEYLTVFVDVKNGKKRLKFTFNSTLNIYSIYMSEGVSTITKNTVKNVQSVGNMQGGNEDEIVLYIDGQNMVYRYVNGLSYTDGWPRHTNNVFGVSQISALLRTVSQTGIYVFTYDTVSEFSTSDWETFTHISTYNVDDPYTSNIWINSPKGVVGAAWLYPSTGSPRYTFLTTTRYYVIYDTENNIVVNRGQICMRIN